MIKRIVRRCQHSWLLMLAVVAVAAAAEPPTRIVLLGDSITHGVRAGVTKEQTFGGQLEALLKSEGRNIEVLNAGVGSERTDLALARVDKVLKNQKPDIVTIMYGANDSYVDPGKTEPRLSVVQYKKNLEELIDRVERAGARPVLMTSPRWADDARPNGLGENSNVRMEPFVQAVRDLAVERRLPIVDHYAAWSEARRNGTVLRSWTTDGLHPNPEGHRIMAKLILPTIGPLLPAGPVPSQPR